MEKSNAFYLTTAIPYVNAKPHLGHALEFVQADAIRRWQRLRGKEVLLLSGADENALKNVRAAEEEGIPVQDFVDKNALVFTKLAEKLHVQFDRFMKGSDRTHHYPASQEIWRRCDTAGDIYKKSYEGIYCVGCEAFYTPDELTEAGECPFHPGRKPEHVSEENYFFRLSKYRQKIIDLVSSGEVTIFPAHRKNEVLSFLKEPLQDISISRSNERAKNWGVPVPGDETQRMYVWFDALNIYQSGVGFGWDEAEYQKWWPADVHVIGKDIVRFHAVYWPAFLLSAKLPLPKALFVHGFITVEGQKMSKTVGNVVDPFDIIGRFGAEPFRYYLLREIPAGEDGDFSIRKLEERYNGDLANGLGNLVARVAALGEKISPVRFDPERDIAPEVRMSINSRRKEYEESFSAFRLNEALSSAWDLIAVADRFLNEKKPWVIDPAGEDFRHALLNAGILAAEISELITPFLPETAEKIKAQIFCTGTVVKIKRAAGIFPRLSR
jgi:methionyl-tRNA synthetase